MVIPAWGSRVSDCRCLHRLRCQASSDWTTFFRLPIPQGTVPLSMTSVRAVNVSRCGCPGRIRAQECKRRILIIRPPWGPCPYLSCWSRTTPAGCCILIHTFRPVRARIFLLCTLGGSQSTVLRARSRSQRVPFHCNIARHVHAVGELHLKLC